MTATPAATSTHADIPAQPMGTTVQYYIHAADNSGRQVSEYPIVGAAGPFSFQVLVDSQESGRRRAGRARLRAESWPNPMRAAAIDPLHARSRRRTTRAGIYDAQGRLVYTAGGRSGSPRACTRCLGRALPERASGRSGSLLLPAGCGWAARDERAGRHALIESTSDSDRDRSRANGGGRFVSTARARCRRRRSPARRSTKRS